MEGGRLVGLLELVGRSVVSLFTCLCFVVVSFWCVCICFVIISLVLVFDFVLCLCPVFRFSDYTDRCVEASSLCSSPTTFGFVC